jgi:hypothetical protein
MNGEAERRKRDAAHWCHDALSGGSAELGCKSVKLLTEARFDLQVFDDSDNQVL